MGDRLVPSFGAAQRHAEVEVELRLIRAPLHRRLEQVDRLLVAALAAQDHRQVVQDVGIVRGLGQPCVVCADRFVVAIEASVYAAQVRPMRGLTRVEARREAQRLDGLLVAPQAEQHGSNHAAG